MTNVESKKIFQVGTQEVRARTEPNLRGMHVRWLAPGEYVEVDPKSRREVGTYVWWKHADGWSAERSRNGEFVYMIEVRPESVMPAPVERAAEKKIFHVSGDQVRVRAEPNLAGAHVRWLMPGDKITVDPRSRTEADNYVWWQHAAGWSAERSLNHKEIYLVEIMPPPVVELSEPVTAPPPESLPTAPVAKKTFQVGNQEVRVRAMPTVRAAMMRWLPVRSTVDVIANSRRESEGYVWWQHADGWSAEKTLDGKDVYLFEPGTVPQLVTPRVADSAAPDAHTLPLRDGLFRRLCLDLNQIRWWQYFGNNVYGYNLWREGKYWYKYSQGLHGGLDFGNSSAPGILVYAGIEGHFFKLDTQSTKPNGLWVKAGDYTVIYGHLVNPRPFHPGDPIGVDTVMGELEFGGQNHLHLEVRYQDRWIVNPLLFMPEEMRNQLIQKFPPNDKYFYRDAGWNQWQTPLDQPVLALGGGLVGPHAPR